MENAVTPKKETRLELNKRQKKRLESAKIQRATAEVKIAAQIRILKGQRAVVISMENLLESLQKELIESEEYIDAVYDTYKV